MVLIFDFCFNWVACLLCIGGSGYFWVGFLALIVCFCFLIVCVLNLDFWWFGLCIWVWDFGFVFDGVFWVDLWLWLFIWSDCEFSGYFCLYV